MALDGGEEARERRERAALAAADAREARAGAVALGGAAGALLETYGADAHGQFHLRSWPVGMRAIGLRSIP